MSEWMDRPSTEVIEAYERKLRRRKRLKGTGLVIAVLIVILVALCILGMLTFAKPYRVSGNAMEPTLSDGAIVLVGSLGSGPAVGDIVVSSVESPEGLYLIRRVIATAGSTVSVDRTTGAVTVDGVLLDEPYVSNLSPGNMDSASAVTVQEDTVYVLGDERASALDSRSDEIGLLPVSSLKGKVIWTLPDF